MVNKEIESLEKELQKLRNEKKEKIRKQNLIKEINELKNENKKQDKLIKFVKKIVREIDRKI